MPYTPQKWLGEIAASTTTTDAQTNPCIAALQDGGFVVVWECNDAAAPGILMQRFDVLGNKVGGEVQVNATPYYNQTRPAVAVLTDGCYVVAWTDHSLEAPDTQNTAIRARHFHADGTPVDSDFLVNTTVAGAQNFPAVSALPGGAYVISWTDWSATGNDVSGTAIRAQRFHANDEQDGGEFLVDTTTTGDQKFSDVVTLNDGSVVMAWEDDSGPGPDVRARIYHPNGTAKGNDFVLNTYVNGAQAGVSLAPLTGGIAGGGFVAVWSSYLATTGWDVMAQMFDADGNKVGGEFPVHSFGIGEQVNPSVTGLKAGGFFVTWMDNGIGGDANGYGIKGQLFDADGNKAGDEILINTIAAGDQRMPEVTELADGRIAVTWTKEAIVDSDDTTGISVQILDTNPGFTLMGGPTNDTITGGSGNDFIYGKGGNDTIDGGAGVNNLFGGNGDDYLTAVGHLNVANGEQGNDQLYFTGNQNQLYGGNGNDWLGVNGNSNALVGGAGDESWIGASGNSNVLAGQDGNDLLFANGTGNHLYGGNNNDWVGVSGNSNALLGEAGFDYLAATGNNNTLDGGADDDTLVAAAGHSGDHFVFQFGYGHDVVQGFAAAGNDVVHLESFGLGSFANLQTYMSQVGADVHIVFDVAHSLILQNLMLGTLNAGHFDLA